MRTRKLLLHRKELNDLHVHVTRKGNTIVPLSLYFRDGRAKLAIGVAKGKDKGDKRQAIAKRDVQRQIDREMKQRD
jgi:SsrA-binding protein